MFTQFFGLKYNPFSKEIQSDHLFVSRDLQEFESRLKYLKQVRGLGLVCGEPGCGKTTALRKFVAELNAIMMCSKPSFARCQAHKAFLFFWLGSGHGLGK